ncbi:invasion associated locus B family protein [Bradyrhizobium sp. ORS 111]|uniref:invasion associated locus B family protein n=1 Tax=Bradyrhizobium sp. ORS 111 TaxID=1685958 RepID=UPI00388E4E2D
MLQFPWLFAALKESRELLSIRDELVPNYASRAAIVSHAWPTRKSRIGGIRAPLMAKETAMRRWLFLLGSFAASLAFPGLGKAADARATQLAYEPWTKVCLTQASCFVSASARGQCSPSGGTISVSPQNSKRVLLTANVATRTMLEGAISLRIDQDDPIRIAKPHCYTLGCGGTYEADGELVTRLKHAQAVTMEAKSLTGQTINLSFPLTHFAQTFDGPGNPQSAKQAPPQLPSCED